MRLDQNRRVTAAGPRFLEAIELHPTRLAIAELALDGGAAGKVASGRKFCRANRKVVRRVGVCYEMDNLLQAWSIRVEPAPMSSIANLLRCDRSAVTWITDRLEERGYVERRSAEHDRRVKLLALTDEGMRVREEIRSRLAVPPEPLSRLSRSEQRTLRDLLRKALDR